MEDNRQYCLKWNNHPRNVANVFERLRQEELFVDVSLATSDRQIIRAHRVLLSAGSGYLEKVLAMNPSDHPTVVLSSVKYKELKLLIDFMYSGEIAVDQQQFPALLEAARWLKIRGLYEDSEEFIEEIGDIKKKEESNMDNNSEKNIHDSPSELSVTPSWPHQEEKLTVHQVPNTAGRKRSHSEESEELEVQSPISGDNNIDEDNSFEESPANKQFKPMYGHIQGVANAVWMMNQNSKQIKANEIDEDVIEVEDQKKEKEIPDIPNLLNLANRSSNNVLQSRLDEHLSSPTKSMLSPSSLNEQLLQAMQLCTNPYLNPMAAMQKPLELLNTSHVGADYTGSYANSFAKFKANSLSPNSKSLNNCLLTSTPVRRYKQYSEESLQAALKEIMNGQSINRSSMKHNIPARTLRDWMKRLNIKSVFTHHSHGKDGNGSRTASQDGDEISLSSISPEPGHTMDLGSLTRPVFGATNNAIFSGSHASASVFPGMKLNMSAVKDEEEIDDDEDRTLKIDEGPLATANITQIAQTAN